MKSIYPIASSSILVFILMLNQIAHAEDSKVQETNTAASASALKVVRDKDTGELRAPTAAEAAAMDLQTETQSLQLRQAPEANSALSSVAGQIQRHANGVTSMVMDPTSFQTLSAKVAKDGAVKLQHGDHQVEINNSASEER